MRKRVYIEPVRVHKRFDVHELGSKIRIRQPERIHPETRPPVVASLFEKSPGLNFLKSSINNAR